MHLCCFQWFLPLFRQFSHCEILGTLQAFSPVFRLIKRIRTVCEWVGWWGGLLVYMLPSHSKDFGMKRCNAPSFSPSVHFCSRFSPSLSTQFPFKTCSSDRDVWPHPAHASAAIYRSISLALFDLWTHRLNSAGGFKEVKFLPQISDSSTVVKEQPRYQLSHGHVLCRLV